MRTLFYIIFGWLFTAGVSYSLGRITLHMAKITGLTGLEIRLIGFLSGSAILSLIVFVLCASHLALKGVFLALGILAIAINSRIRLPRHPPRAGSLMWPQMLLLGPVLLFAFVYLMNALAPEVSPDGSAYHLGFVTRYSLWHGFRPITTNMYANMPQGMEMLFLFGFAFGRHSAAALVHLTFLFVLVLMMWSFGMRHGKPIAGAAAAAIVFLSPIFGVDAASAYNDVALAAVSLGAFYLAELWRESRSRAALFLAGILGGFAFGLKYTGGVVPIYLVYTVAISRPRTRLLLTLLLPAAAISLPWIIKNAVVTGNPVSPFFNALFPNRTVHVSFEREYSQHMRQFGLTGPHALPWALAWDGSPGGTLGPVFLLLPLGLLSLRHSSGRRLWLAALMFAMMYPFNTGTRFLMMSSPLFALLIADGIRWPPLLCALILGQGLFAWPAVLQNLKAPTCWSLSEVPVRAAFRVEPQETFIRRRLPHYDMARFIEKTVPVDQRVLALDPIAEAYTTKTVLVSYQSAEGELERNILLSPVLQALMPNRVQQIVFPARTVRGVRLVSDKFNDSDAWTINELSLSLRGLVVPPGTTWTVTADPNPWDAWSALDGNLATSWATWQAVHPGMYFSLKLDHPITIDAIGLISTRRFQELSVDLLLDDGTQVRVIRTVQTTSAVDLGCLRRAAISAVKRRGTAFLMVPNRTAITPEFLDNQDEWGISLLGEWGNGRLYRFN